MTKDPHRILILGGGVAGLELATRLSALPRFQVTLIDREPAHVWKPMLHTIAAGTRDVQQQQTPYLGQAARCGFAFHPGEVRGIDRAACAVELAPILSPDLGEVVPARRIGFDTLVVALGSRANDFGTEGVAEHCDTIDSRVQALAFQEQLRLRLIRSTVDQSLLTIAIVGAGAAGVELSAELVQMASHAEAYGARRASDRLRVVLLESGPAILAAFPPRVSESALRRLHDLGIEVRTGARVARATAEGFVLADGETVAADMRVWAAGVQAPAVIAAMEGIALSRNGQIIVDGNLRSISDPAILALGDVSSLQPEGWDRPLPPTAQVAHQQAGYLARHLPRLIAGTAVPPFRFRDAGALVSLGGYGAYGSLGKFGLFRGGFIQGRIARLGHVMLYRSHQARLHGFWRGSLIWLVDVLNGRLRPRIRLG
ncbi:NAD(P)/FAD-dependent oxidoreductase [Paracoccus yeei]|uniref:NAD(P)/FAD-dependent oxidoreductase n=1 Tax=Paracoccus yeei TaxID=147645 RepID=A0A5P2QUN8_9RHOB|nr:NAD(P)/FAD-dependent oxidoreductase [Paracoccus yeei]QEU09510.1 NAD(P)/FAD-dependent oxidoreductase [Paracoccus yeei]